MHRCLSLQSLDLSEESLSGLHDRFLPGLLKMLLDKTVRYTDLAKNSIVLRNSTYRCVSLFVHSLGQSEERLNVVHDPILPGLLKMLLEKTVRYTVLALNSIFL